MSALSAQKLARLQAIVAERAAWSEPLAQVKRMHQWVLDAEHILDGSWAQAGEVVSNETVGQRLDAWRETMSKQLTDGMLSDLEQECLAQFWAASSRTGDRTWCSATTGRTFRAPYPEMERSIRGLKTQSRRISGRKNGNSYLLRYGRCVAYAVWWEQNADRQRQLEQRAARLDRARWRELRRETTAAQSEQLKRFRFRHKRESSLSSLEERWAAASPTPLLP